MNWMLNELADCCFHRFPAALIVLMLVGLSVICCDATAEEATSQASETKAADAQTEKINKLVSGLGDDDYLVRERSGERLLDVGGDAIPALEKAARHHDREIRYRAQRLLVLIRKFDFQRRLDAFIADTSGQRDYRLPSWDRVRDLIGDTPVTRSLYVEMVRSEPELFQNLETNPGAVSHDIEKRIVEVRQDFSLPTEPLEFAPTATLLFMATQITFSDELIDETLALCGQGGFHKAISESSYRDPLRVMLGRVIEKVDKSSATMALPLALHHDIKEGLTLAVKILSLPVDRVDRSEMDICRWAVFTVAKFGDRSHTAVLEKWLDDDTQFISPTIAAHRNYETQLRDIVLAALWHLHGEDPRQHGFSEHLQTDPHSVFQTATIGFENATQRQAAMKAWRDFRGTLEEKEQQ